MSAKHFPKHLQDLYRHGEKCRSKMLSILNSWPVGEYSRRIEFEIRTGRDQEMILQMLREIELWIKALAALRVYEDNRRINDILAGVQFALFQDEYRDNAVDEAGSLMDEALSMLTSISVSDAKSIKASNRAPRIRKGTAFIMMAMGESPELEDICLTIKRVCKGHGFRAIRADDILHGGIIMDQIHHHIASAELLIGDLTGEMPNVYFEIGCALTMRREPILFRKYGTKLHFDLAAHNIPEYKNFRELESLLGDRLKGLRPCRN